MVTLKRKKLSKKELTEELSCLQRQLVSINEMVNNLSNEVKQNRVDIEKMCEENKKLVQKNDEYLETIKNTPDASTIMREWLMGGN